MPPNVRLAVQPLMFGSRSAQRNDEGKVKGGEAWRHYLAGNQPKRMTLCGEEFLQRFLLHVLLSGFTCIRHYESQPPQQIRPSPLPSVHPHRDPGRAFTPIGLCTLSIPDRAVLEPLFRVWSGAFVRASQRPKFIAPPECPIRGEAASMSGGELDNSRPTYPCEGLQSGHPGNCRGLIPHRIPLAV